MKRVAIMIVNDEVLFPNMEYRIETNKQEVLHFLKNIEDGCQEEFALIHSLDNFSTTDVTQFPSIGVATFLSLKLAIPNSKMRAVFRVSSRVRLSNYEIENGLLYADMESLEMLPVSKEDTLIYTDMLIRSYEKYVHLVSASSNAMFNQLSGILSLHDLTDVLATLSTVSNAVKKRLLYEENPVIRAKILLEQLKEGMAFAEIENEIDKKVKQQLDDEQRSFYLKAKMKAITQELGEENSKNHEIDQYKKKLNRLKASESVKSRIKEEIMRYETASASSPEIVMMKDYIEWMLALPWEKETKDETDLKKIAKTLEENHFGMQDAKERILEYIAVKQHATKDNSPILCLIGPPGVGKTSLAYSIAKSLHRNLATVSVGGVRDEAEIVGHRRTYIGALPGRVIQGMKKVGSCNPVFVIDELDKMTKDIKGDPASSLLEVLDKEQNFHFSDHYIEEAFDLSKVMFIATANYEEQIPLELKDRLEIIYIPSYTEYEKVKIATDYFIPKAMDEAGLTSLQVSFEEDTLFAIIRSYTKEAGVRDLNRLLSKILRKIVRKTLEGSDTFHYHITPDSLESYLGKKLYFYHEQQEKMEIGVVNGLAYTPFGGDILPIETTFYKGKGDLILTGSLGDVMQESAQIALSYIKAHHQEFGILLTRFNDDIHIHLPEGAVSKDGPSAGIALTTSLISSLIQKEISSKIAMTGEITLRGRILAIGGLREKVIGAYRAGIQIIYLPKENEKDFDEIPPEIQKVMTFRFVENYQEVAKDLF